MHKISFSLVLAASMLAAGGVNAQTSTGAGAAGTGAGIGTTSPATPGMKAPNNLGTSPSSTTTGASSQINTSGVNQPGVPNTTSPGTIGTGASPSGLPGDSTSTPGYPSGVGNNR